MLRTVASVIAGLAVGFAVAAFWPPGGGDRADPGRSFETADFRRIADLELALHDERERREALEQRLDEVDAALAALARSAGPSDAGAAPAAAERARNDRATDAVAEAAADQPAPARPVRGPRVPGPEQRVERLVNGGFTPQRAQWLLDRTEELRMQSLQAVYDARREGRPVDQAAFADELSLLRQEIGDAEYEQYLTALGRPTAVPVGDVLVRSPAETAGLRSGDQILSYGGKRVFDMRELNRLTYEGQPGQPVVVEVLRDGQRMQVVLPRGPVGITAGRFGRR